MLAHPFPAALFYIKLPDIPSGLARRNSPVSVHPAMLRTILLDAGGPELTCYPPSDPSVVSQEQALSFGSGCVDVTEYVLEK